MTTKFKKGYKYQLHEDLELRIGLRPPLTIQTKFITLLINGELTLKAGYAWDGATGAMDTDTFITSSAVHDALYQLFRAGLLDRKHRNYADILLREISIEKGMWRVRAWGAYQMVKRLGWLFIKKPREILEAP